MNALLLTAALLLEAQAAEVRWALPHLLLVAVIAHESGGRQRLVVRERGGHCSAGPAQVLIRNCDRSRLQRLLVLSTNLDEGARILARSREICRRHPRWRACRRSEWALYNSGSASWWRGVASKWRRLRWRPGALPGPARGARSIEQIEALQAVTEQLLQVLPSLRYWVRHSGIDPHKRDPGSGLPDSWAEGLLVQG